MRIELGGIWVNDFWVILVFVGKNYFGYKNSGIASNIAKSGSNQSAQLGRSGGGSGFGGPNPGKDVTNKVIGGDGQSGVSKGKRLSLRVGKSGCVKVDKDGCSSSSGKSKKGSFVEKYSSLNYQRCLTNDELEDSGTLQQLHHNALAFKASQQLGFSFRELVDDV
ncbi:hypothetical protein ACOSQ2_018446 [Xanthoceras sorbifolium]